MVPQLLVMMAFGAREIRIQGADGAEGSGGLVYLYLIPTRNPQKLFLVSCLCVSFPVFGVWLPCVCGDLTWPAGQDAAITEVTHNLTNVSGPISPGVPNRVNTTLRPRH